MEIQLAKAMFVVLQFTNIVISSMLIVTGVFLFSYIKRILRHIDGYLHFMIALHILASILILSSYELKSLDTDQMGRQYLVQLTILTLITINVMFQAGIYRFFYNGKCKLCVINDFLDFLKNRGSQDGPMQAEAVCPVYRQMECANWQRDCRAPNDERNE